MENANQNAEQNANPPQNNPNQEDSSTSKKQRELVLASLPIKMAKLKTKNEAQMEKSLELCGNAFDKEDFSDFTVVVGDRKFKQLKEFEDQVMSHFGQIHYKQNDALEEQKKLEDTRIFTFETPMSKKGGRRFICTEIHKFWQFYKSWPRERWFYEMIQEQFPCRPHFDLEFYKIYNPELDPTTCFNEFLAICKRCFSERFNAHLSDKNFLTLDSSTSDKFSAHVIVHLPESRLFSSNLAMEPFVAWICEEMRAKRKCIVTNQCGREEFLCDTSIYTRNRQFRLFLSSKMGKDSRLVYAQYCGFYETEPSEEQIFYDSLVVPSNYKECPLIDSKPTTTTNIPPQIPSQPSCSVQKPTGPMKFGTGRSKNCVQLADGTGKSPFPELDQFLLNSLKEVSPKAQILNWTLQLNGEERQIKYQLKNSRFCFNVMEEHEKDNVHWIFDLQKLTCFQFCLDSECEYYNSGKTKFDASSIGHLIKGNIDRVFEQYDGKQKGL